MFKLLWAGLRYSKYSIIFGYCLYLGLFIFALLAKSDNYVDIWFLMMSSSIVFFVMLIIGITQVVVEKRYRFTTLLPVSDKTLGKLDFLGIILANASIFVLWIILYLTKYIQQEPRLIWTMISFSMHIFIVYGLFAIGAEFGFYFNKFRKTILLLSITCSISFFIFTIRSITYTFFKMNFEAPLFKAYMNFVKSPSGALIMSLVAGILLYLIYILYINRRYYRIII